MREHPDELKSGIYRNDADLSELVKTRPGHLSTFSTKMIAVILTTSNFRPTFSRAVKENRLLRHIPLKELNLTRTVAAALRFLKTDEKFSERTKTQVSLFLYEIVERPFPIQTVLSIFSNLVESTSFCLSLEDENVAEMFISCWIDIDTALGLIN